MRKNFSSGFTLIETLVYLALFTLIIGGFVMASYALFESAGRNQSKAMLQDEENFIMGKILFSLESAKTINVPVAGASGSSLSITKYDNMQAQFCLAGPLAKDAYYLGGSGSCTASGAALNNSNVKVTFLKFSHFDNGTNPESVQVELVVSTQIPNGMTISESASSTRYLRK